MFRYQVLLSICLLVFLVKYAHGECNVTDDVCEFWLEIENKMTMMYQRDAVYAFNGKIYTYDVPEANASSADEIDPDQVIVADGWEVQRLVVVANGSLPGPPIEVFENQTVIVHVKNNMISDGVTIHWHGLPQRGTPWMDGVAFITQCPINPGSSFTYQFKASPKGTFWYHSHIGTQLGNGVVGAFIIRERKAVSMEHIMVLQDWNHDWDADVGLLKSEYGNFRNREKISNFLFQSGLINGKGRYFNDSADPVHETPLTVYEVDPHKEYRFRVIGATSRYPFRVSIDGHVLQMVASDGYDVQPQYVESFIINAGERYDFTLVTNQTSDNYWVRAETLEVNVVNHVALAILRYKGSIEKDPIYRNRTCSPTNRCKVINCPFMYYPENEHTDCMAFSELKALVPNEAPSANEEVEDIFLNFGFPASANGIQFQSPQAPLLSQSEEADTCGPDHKCEEQKTCSCTLSVSLTLGKTYNIIMSNLGKGKGGVHPMHMHGHSFQVIKMGFPSYDNVTGEILEDNPDIDCRGNVNSSESLCNSPTWSNGSWSGNNIPGIDLERAPRKDTVMVPTHGYTVVQIKADNPGVWFLHCHIELHHLEGMALVLNEAFEKVPPPPNNFPKCGNYLGNTTLSNNTETGPETDRREYEEDCHDKRYFVAIGVLAAAVVIQFGIIVCLLCWKRRNTQKDVTENTATYQNKAFSQ